MLNTKRNSRPLLLTVQVAERIKHDTHWKQWWNNKINTSSSNHKMLANKISHQYVVTMKNFTLSCLLSTEHELRQKTKNFKPPWRFHQLQSGFLAKGHFPRVLRQPRLSTNDKGNEIIPEIVLRSPGTCFTAEENPGKPQPGDRRWRLCGQSSLKWGSLLRNEVGRIAHHARKDECRK